MAKQESNLTRKSIFNTFSAFLVYGIELGAGFFVHKILLGVLGPIAFGAWQIGLRLLTFVLTGEGPLSEALKWVVANKHSTTDEQGLRRYVGSAQILWGLLALPILALGALLSWYTPQFIHNLPIKLYSVVRLMAFILVIRLLVITWARLSLAVLQGMNLAYKAIWVRSGLALFSAVLLVLAAELNFGLPGLAGALLVVGGVSSGVFWLMTKRYVSWYGAARPNKKDFKTLSEFGGWMLAGALINRMLFLSDVVILGWVEGATSVTVFTFSQYAPRMGVQLIVLMAGAVAPGLGKVFGEGKLQSAKEIRSQLFVVVWLLFLVLGACVLIWNNSLVGLWVGEDKFAGQRINALLVVMFLQMAFIRVDAFVIDVSLDVKRKAFLGVLASVVSLSLALALGKPFGMVGMILGLIGGRSILSVLYPILASRILESGRAFDLSSLWRPIVVTIFVFCFSFFAGEVILTKNWIYLIMYGLSTSLIVSVLGFYSGLNKNQRKNLFSRLKNIGPLRLYH